MTGRVWQWLQGQARFVACANRGLPTSTHEGFAAISETPGILASRSPALTIETSEVT